MNKAKSSRDQTTSGQSPRLGNFLFFVISLFVLWTLRATVLFFIDERIHSDLLRLIYSLAVKIALWVVPVVGYLYIVDKQDPFRYLKLTTRINRKGLVYAAIVSVIYFLATVVFESLVSGKHLASPSGLGLSEWLEPLLFLSLSPMSEEILFRGFILNKLRERMSFWTANAVTTGFFVLVHWPNWLWRNGFQSWMIYTAGSILILSLLLGWLVKKTQSLWPSIIVHVINNFLARLLGV
jgi:membrane protease YdiL (CAAX protease family)